MNNTIKVVKFEIIRQLKKPAFWVAILLMPILMIGVFLIGMIAEENSIDSNSTLDAETVVAIIDDSNILPDGNPYTNICSSHEDCIEKIKNGSVDLYYYIPADFEDTRKAALYRISEGLDLLNSDVNILKNILGEITAQKLDTLDAILLSQNYEIVDNKLSANGEDANALGRAVIPIVILVIYFIFVALFGNRFLMAVVEEKENRISEMILTAVSSKHLVVGKILAMLVLGVIQILTFIIPVFIILMVNLDNPIIKTILSSIEVEPVAIIMNIVLFVVSVLLYASTCVFVGSLVSTARDASSFIGPAIIAMVFPLYFMQLFFEAEPSFLVYFLTYFPLSAPIALMLRNAFGTLGMAEFIIGLTEVVVVAIIMTRLAVMTFQKNAINFERVRLKENLKWKKNA